MSKTNDPENDGPPAATRRGFLQKTGAGAAALAAYPMSHEGGDDGWFSGLFNSAVDLTVMHDGEVVSHSLEELNIEGTAITEVTEVNAYDGRIRITIDGGSGGGGGAFEDTDGDGVAELQEDHADFAGGDARNIRNAGAAGNPMDTAYVTSISGDGDTVDIGPGVSTDKLYNKVITVDPSDAAGDAGKAFNDARAKHGFGEDLLFRFAAGQHLVSTPMDWTAQGSSTAVEGPDIDLRGAHLDPDVGAGNHVIEQVGVRSMTVIGGKIENVNGSGCETAIIQARNSNGARPERNVFSGTHLDDPGAGTCALANVGCPNTRYENSLLRSLADVIHQIGSDNPDGFTLTHDTIDGAPADAVVNTFKGCFIVGHGASTSQTIQIGGAIDGTTFKDCFIENNQGVPNVDVIDGGESSVIPGVSFERISPGNGSDFIYVGAGETAELRDWHVGITGGFSGTGYVFNQNEGTQEMRHMTFGPQFETQKGVSIAGTWKWGSINAEQIRRMGNAPVTGGGRVENIRVYGAGQSDMGIASGSRIKVTYFFDGFKVETAGQYAKLSPSGYAEISDGTNTHRWYPIRDSGTDGNPHTASGSGDFYIDTAANPPVWKVDDPTDSAWETMN